MSSLMWHEFYWCRSGLLTTTWFKFTCQIYSLTKLLLLLFLLILLFVDTRYITALVRKCTGTKKQTPAHRPNVGWFSFCQNVLIWVMLYRKCYRGTFHSLWCQTDDIVVVQSIDLTQWTQHGSVWTSSVRCHIAMKIASKQVSKNISTQHS